MSAAFDAANRPAPTRVGAPRFIMIGGFLGAGKTTLAARLGSHLRSLGQSVAFITNDYGSDIFDTRFLRAQGFVAEEVSGGSFAARFDALTAAGAKLTELNPPDAFIVEPAGNSADLLATVQYPLRRLFKSNYSVAPFSVAVDPVLASRFLNLEKGAAFSDKISYLYRKQLEEADFILINKIDLLAPAVLNSLRNRLRRDFPEARLLEVSARTGAGMDLWCNAMASEAPPARLASPIEFENYASGEASIGSLNCAVQLSALKGFQCNPILRELAKTIQRRLQAQRIEIAHLKMILSADVDVDGMAMLHLVHDDLEPEVGEELVEPVERGQLRLSLRAEGKPDVLHAVVTDALTHLCSVFPGLFARLAEMEHFRASPSKALHRIMDINAP